MTNVVSVHSELPRRLDFHMIHILDQDETSIIYFDDAFENNEEDPSIYYFSITTRSGKVLQPESDISMKKEINVEEELSPNTRLAPRKVTNEKSIEGVKEEPNVKALIPLLKLPIPLPPFTQWMKKKHEDKEAKYHDMLKQVSLCILFIKAFNEIPGLAKYLKELLTKK
ncbi:hypothetical protein HAX54_025386 [Datura stramonium]|uniref:Uncharacterized protein n=1 Tax=Datura stramonium TaxID=4076 RepID=A0ABS8V0J4_DATST|nr:hypothetical protein [Datura stramonium]